MEQIAVGDVALANALATLLTTESLLFAAFTLAVNLSAPSQRVRRWLIPGPVLVGVAIGALLFVAIGAGTAWFEIFGFRALERFHRALTPTRPDTRRAESEGGPCRDGGAGVWRARWASA